MAAAGVEPKGLVRRRHERVPGLVLRRVCLTATIGVLFLHVTAAPAFAWWDFIEEFTGPRKFYGWDLQLRLLCVVTPDRASRSEIRTSAPIGLLLSACRREDDDKQRLAVDLGVRFLRSTEYENDATPEFANGRKIHFTTLEPAVMFPLAAKGDLRLEYGFGAGVYWFSSEGFQSFNGVFLEPVRFDVHIPTGLTWVRALILRVGVLHFPSGFDANAWAGSPGQARIAAEWVPTYSVFADLRPVAKKVSEKLNLW
jgi:hypothetical protein